MLMEGMEVLVNCEVISGAGVIKSIGSDSFYPVEVEMNEADPDGHKIFRFNHKEITPLEVEKKEEAVEEDQAPEIQAVKLDKIIGGYSLQVGECFTAKQKSKTHYWIYQEGSLRGCFPVKNFSMITMADLEIYEKRQAAAKEIASVIVQDIVTVAALEEAEQREKELKEQAKKAKKKKKKPKKLSYRQLEEQGQTTIFEFI
jgi:hypothetical protein